MQLLIQYIQKEWFILTFQSSDHVLDYRGDWSLLHLPLLSRSKPGGPKHTIDPLKPIKAFPKTWNMHRELGLKPPLSSTATLIWIVLRPYGICRGERYQYVRANKMITIISNQVQIPTNLVIVFQNPNGAIEQIQPFLRRTHRQEARTELVISICSGSP